MASDDAGRRPPRLAVLDALRRGHATVNALAAALDVTDNAVRLHLASLERDGLVVRRGTVKTGTAGQPAAEYDLTAAGELALSRAYPAVLTALVGAMTQRLEPRTLRAVFGDAGRRLGGEVGPAAPGTLPHRAQACVDLLNSLGGSARASVGRREAIVTGDGCPLAAAVRAAPATCTLVEALLERHAGVAAVHECDQGERPHCRFRLTLPA